MVVGNPPFLNQLERLTAHRPGVAARLNELSRGVLRPYTDVSAVFLQRATGWVRPGGRVALVQPQSLLAARDAAGVRADVTSTSSLDVLWASDLPVFDAHVLTCAPVLRRGGQQGAVRRFHGPGFEELAPREDPELGGGGGPTCSRPASGSPRSPSVSSTACWVTSRTARRTSATSTTACGPTCAEAAECPDGRPWSPAVSSTPRSACGPTADPFPQAALGCAGDQPARPGRHRPRSGGPGRASFRRCWSAPRGGWSRRWPTRQGSGCPASRR